MTVLTLVCGLMIPRININEDMTEYLPNDSQMRSGLNKIKAFFPSVDLNAYTVKVMFKGAPERADSLLLETEGISGITATKNKGEYTLFSLSVEDGADPKAAAAIIGERFGDTVVVETNANSNMPDNMVPILLAGTVIIFGILFLMCSSLMEAILFIITIGMAVVINMGTNSLLPSVSMMTNTIVAVLQMVLSMDYSIILMNRYRQEKERYESPGEAMSQALRRASSSILSSSLTTIVGLLVLIFMKFRIGMDLGLVLSKGVFCSLISIYTILPGLVLIFDGAIKKTSKKVPIPPTDGLARFEMRFRIPLTLLFIALFISTAYLQGKTELSYASIWESKISDVFPPENIITVVYNTGEEEKLIPVIDGLNDNSHVITALSYPSILLKEMTPVEMIESINELGGLVPGGMDMDTSLLNPETLRILYYALSHPERDEKLNFTQMQELASTANNSGLMPEGIDVQEIAEQFMPDGGLLGETSPELQPSPAVIDSIGPPTDANASASIDSISLAGVMSVQTPVDAVAPSSGEGAAVPDNTEPDNGICFSYSNCTEQLSAGKMAEFLGFDKQQATTLYRLAGKKKDGATMSAVEFMAFVRRNILRNKVFRMMINKEQLKGFELASRQIDSVVAAGPVLAIVTEPSSAYARPTEPLDTLARASDAAADVEPLIADVEEQEEELSPMEVLAEMAFSGRSFNAGQLYEALKNAGIDIDFDLIKLLYMYHGSCNYYDETTTLSLKTLVDFLTGEFLEDEAWSQFVDDATRGQLEGLGKQMDEGLADLRSNYWSLAVIVTDYPLESGDTFDFIESLSTSCNNALGSEFYIVGESAMYKEMKEGFRHELLILTLLTIAAIFIIVALTFKSVIIPLILVLTVLSGVYVNVFVSGLGGRTMLYLAYLIVQSILMGATIDYGILFTNYYLESRKKGLDKLQALTSAYRGSIHTIMTSGLIIVVAPYVMSVLLTDPTICSILSSLTFGALAAILLILFTLPASLAAFDRIICRKLE